MGDLAGPPARLSLDGDGWRCRPLLGDEWQHLRLGVAAEPGRGGWLPARVPGSVVADLGRAGEVPDPYVGRNSRFSEWAAERWWAYQTDFEAPLLAEGERLELVLEGIDYAGRVYLDGELLGEHAGMFVPARFDVAERLKRGGRHVLDALLAPAPENESQTGDTARVRVHKARMCYGWDFCPRLVHQGLWQPVWLRRTGPLRLERPWLRWQLADDHGHARLLIEAELDSSVAGRAGLRLSIRLGGRQLAARSHELDVQADRTTVRLELEIERPALWWPNGQGQQPLHDIELVAELDGRPSDRLGIHSGVRSVRLEANEGAPPGARPYTFVVNGRRLYINGWNWVPIDMLYGPPRPAKLRHLLELARSAHVNLLRVWGGGLIEGEEFYEACDRLGMLVWQEFSQSSSGAHNAPAEDPDFVEFMREQAQAIVPRRRNHTSLAVWCGGNELMREGRPLDEGAPVLRALADVVRQLDPERPFLPSSPSGPLADFPKLPAGTLGHDVHGPWEHQGLGDQQRLYESRSAMLHSEFGVEGMTNLAALEATIAPGERWPATRDNPVYAHRGAWWINEPLVQAVFGGGIDDLATLARASQWLQADGLRYAVEAHLRRRWRSSGTLPWQFNEPFPNAWCTAVVDYYGRPKPAYHAVAAAYEPLHASAAFERQAWLETTDFEAHLWVTSSLPESTPCRLLARVLAADGTEAARLEGALDCAGLAAAPLGEMSVPLDRIATELFLLDLELVAVDGSASSRNQYVFSRTADMAPLRRLPTVPLVLSRRPLGADAWRIELHNTGAWLAPAIRVEDARPADETGWAVPASDLPTLLPGEQRTIEVQFVGLPAAQRRLRVSGWNVAEQWLD